MTDNDDAGMLIGPHVPAGRLHFEPTSPWSHNTCLVTLHTSQSFSDVLADFRRSHGLKLSTIPFNSSSFPTFLTGMDLGFYGIIAEWKMTTAAWSEYSP